MVRLTHLSGSLQGTSSTSPNAVIRIGRGNDADVRYASTDTKVSTRHSEVRFDGSAYTLSDVGSSNGTLVNGKKITKPTKLRNGDKIMFGAGGPEASFNIDNSMSAADITGSHKPLPPMAYGGQPSAQNQFTPMPQQPQFAAPKMAPVAGQPHKDANQVAREAQAKIAQARAMSGGQPSGQTMFIMASALEQVQASSTQKAEKKAGKVILGIVLVALVVGGGMGYVIWDQKQQLEKITEKKQSADKQIQKIQLQMQLENDPEKLAALDAELTLLTGKAQQAIGEMEQKDKGKAAEMAEGGDELDHQIRSILRKFGADTYAVPPIFKERLKFYLDRMSKQASTKQVWARKKQYWPIIQKEFAAEGMPEEMAYVAWQESNFNPIAESPVGARGMWQFMDFQARKYGLHVAENWRNGGIDERTDAAKETKIAAKYLADLLSEFGADSFMLAIASYNKGENGMRNVLHKVGFRNRDFWHLYRMKLLPDETSEYVPQIIAAAIVGNNPQKYGLQP
jgi:hypothetical protein